MSARLLRFARKSALRSSAALAAIALLGAQNAAAQTAPAEAANADSGEIVVTAQKREQNLNDVGLSVVAISGDSLVKRGVSSLADIASIVPALSFTQSADNTPVYTLRGIGFYDTSLAAYPTVSIYVDEVPLPFPAMTRHSAFDLQRIEVLQGPQGTLFGQNATGGAINFIAAKPTSTLAAGATIQFGRFNTLQADAYVSGPISSDLNVRLAARVERGDGWQISNTRPNDRLGKVRNYMGRFIADYQPSDGIRFQLNLNGWIDKSDTQAPQYFGYRPQFAAVDPLLTAAPFSPSTPRAADWTPGIPFADNSMWQASLRADIDLTDAITLTSLTSYADYRQHQGNEVDGLAISSFDQRANDGRIKTFSQELRLSNGGKGPLRWIIGGNYEASRVVQTADLYYPNASAHETLSQIGFPVDNNGYRSVQRMRNYAAFANAELDAGALTFRAGGRFTQANRQASLCAFDASPAQATGNFFYNVLLGGAYGSYVPGSCFVLNADAQSRPVVDYLPFFAPGEYRGTLNESNFSYRLGVDWKARDGLLLYANVAKGYKAGGFPTLTASQMAQFRPVTQESVMSYELGAKFQSRDRAFQLNMSAFYYDYRNKQLLSKLVDPVFGVLDVLQNIPQSSIYGADFSATIRPTKGLTFNLSGAYLDAKVKRYTGINGAGIAADFQGTRVPYTPKFQVSVNGDYEWPVGDSLQASLGFSLNYRSDTVAVIGGDLPGITGTYSVPEPYVIPDYTLVDLRAGIGRPDGKWKVEAIVKNLGNTYYVTNVFAALDTLSRFAGPPRTYAIRASWKY